MKKTVILSLSALFFCGSLFAPPFPSSARQLKNRLSDPDPATGAVVRVEEPASLEAALNRTDSLDRQVPGYRIRIFFDNSQDARQSANAIRTRFQSRFPDIPAYLFYDNPYFKVAVGDCLTMDEAMIVWGRVKNEFTSAFIVQENIPLKNFIHSTPVVEAGTDSIPPSETEE